MNKAMMSRAALEREELDRRLAFWERLETTHRSLAFSVRSSGSFKPLKSWDTVPRGMVVILQLVQPVKSPQGR